MPQKRSEMAQEPFEREQNGSRGVTEWELLKEKVCKRFSLGRILQLFPSALELQKKN